MDSKHQTIFIVAGLVALVLIGAWLWTSSQPEDIEVIFQYECEYEEEKDRTKFVIKAWNQTDDIVWVDRLGFNVDGSRTFAYSSDGIRLSPYGMEEFTIYTEGNMRGHTPNYIHDLSVRFQHADLISNF